MADNAQKLPLGSAIYERTRRTVLEHIQLMSGAAPGTIDAIDKTNTILTIKFETNDKTYKLPKVTIPVHGSEYTRFPYKKGDKGVVSLADFDFGNMSGLSDQNPAEFTRPANLSALLWHPVGNKNFSETDDQKSHLSYAPNGTIARDDQKISKVTTHPTNGAQISSAKGDHTVTAHADDTGIVHKSTKKVKTDAPTHEVTQDQTVGGNNTVGGDVTATGSVTGATGNFAGGMSGGGLQMVSGLITALSGGGGGVGAGSLADGAAAGNLGITTGLPVYAGQAAALAALGSGKLYVDSSLGRVSASTIPVTGGGSGSVDIPAVLSFYDQGIFVVCVTSHA